MISRMYIARKAEATNPEMISRMYIARKAEATNQI